jgi:DNA-binding transcriptional LysR family regulator
VDLTLKQLRAFVAVAEAGHFTRAAENLELSQSAVSTLIRQLEKNLGLRLFDRHTRLLRLTEAGEEILLVAKRAVADIEGVIESSRQLSSLHRGRVSIASGTLQAALFLPRLIRAFNQRHPMIKVDLHDVAESTVLDMISNGAADIGLGTVPRDDVKFASTILTTDIFLVVMRPDHPLAHRRNLRWQDLAEVPMIGPQRGNPIRERLENELAREGILLSFHRSLQEVSLPLTIIGMVEADLGVAIMTTAVTRLVTSMGLVTRTPKSPVIAREISLIARRDRSLSPAARHFRDFLLAEGREGTRAAK